MDAVRILDGKFVALKKASKSRNPDEVNTLNLFSSETLGNDPANHCVPVFDVLVVPDDENHIIIVMPLLRRYDTPWFSNIGEAVECIHQLFEGMQFMHQNKVAHRDAARSSFMMDASEMYPEGYHPRDINKSRDYARDAKHHTRTQKPPKYYFVGFGKAKVYSERPALDMPMWGFDKTVPEFSTSTSRQCDPFATDIYYLGNMLKEDFILTKKGFKFLTELVNDMTNDDPALRPNMDEIVRRFDEIRQTLKNGKLRSRVAGRYDDVITDLMEGVPHMARRAANSISLRRSKSK
jgi:serine/threonine protein kinase